MAAICSGDSVLLQGNYQTTAGTYYDTLASVNGCDSVIATTLTVNSLPTTSITPSGTTTFCQGNSVTLSASSATFYLWSNSATTQSITVSTSGNYFVTVTDSNGCSATSSATTLSVLQNSSSAQTITACDSYIWNSNTYTASGTYTDTIPNAMGCDSVMTLNLTINMVDTSVTASANSLTANATGATYQWLDCNNNYAVISGATNQIYTPTITGNYAIAVTKNGCTDTSSCYNVTVTGILENGKDAKFSVYPNPTRGLFTIEFANRKNMLYEITDISGKVIHKGMLTDKRTTVDLSKNEAGVYLLKIDGRNMQLVKQ